MDKKYKQIILMLLNSDYVPVQEISVTLKKTNRTIRNYINELNNLLERNGATITSVYNKGYCLNINDEPLFLDFVSQMDYNDQDYNISENRITEIFYQLMFANQYTKQEDLMTKLCISSKQLKEDLSAIKELLKQFDLTIQFKPHYGMYIKGKEYNKRLCISKFLIVYGDCLFQDNVECFKDLKESIKNIVLTCIAHQNYDISDQNLMNLVDCITISMIRNKEGHYLEEVKDLPINEYPVQYSIANNIVDMLNKVLDIHFNNNELKYVLIELLSKESKVLENNQNISYDMQILIENMLQRIKKHFGIVLLNDLNLFISLNQHIEPLLLRIKYRNYIHNPLTEEIKVKLYQSYEMAMVACEAINEKYHVILPEDEIALIALHIDLSYEKNIQTITKKNILIVCASGGITAKLLRENFIKRFSTFINKIDIIAMRQLDSLNLDDYQCIFTTIQIDIETKVPVIHIDSIIGDNDYNKIEQSLNQPDNSLKYFDPRLVLFQFSCHNKHDCICKMIEHAKQYYNIPDEYQDLVFTRETLGNTEFDGIIALPHAIYPITEETFIVIAVLKKPILWNKNKVSIVIMISLSANESQLRANEIYRIITKILSQKVLQSKLLRCRHYEELTSLLGDYL